MTEQGQPKGSLGGRVKKRMMVGAGEYQDKGRGAKDRQV